VHFVALLLPWMRDDYWLLVDAIAHIFLVVAIVIMVACSVIDNSLASLSSSLLVDVVSLSVYSLEMVVCVV